MKPRRLAHSGLGPVSRPPGDREAFDDDEVRLGHIAGGLLRHIHPRASAPEPRYGHASSRSGRAHWTPVPATRGQRAPWRYVPCVMADHIFLSIGLLLILGLVLSGAISHWRHGDDERLLVFGKHGVAGAIHVVLLWLRSVRAIGSTGGVTVRCSTSPRVMLRFSHTRHKEHWNRSVQPRLPWSVPPARTAAEIGGLNCSRATRAWLSSSTSVSTRIMNASNSSREWKRATRCETRCSTRPAHDG